MSAPTCINTDRFTSKDLLVQILPCADVAQEHIQVLSFHTDIASGTFKLRVNGEETAAITYNATIATLLTSINTALDNLDVLAAGEIVATGASDAAITLTSNVEKYYVIDVNGDALTGNSTDEPNVTSVVSQQGTTLYTLSSQISSFGYEESVDTVEVTAISEYEATEIPVKSMMTWNASVFEANEAWKHAVFAGQSGIMYVYPRGKVVGRPYFAFRALIEKVGVEFPDHDVVEATFDGQRQGAMIVPFNSIYKG
jgi:hypothetical protein